MELKSCLFKEKNSFVFKFSDTTIIFWILKFTSNTLDCVTNKSFSWRLYLMFDFTIFFRVGDTERISPFPKIKKELVRTTPFTKICRWEIICRACDNVNAKFERSKTMSKRCSNKLARPLGLEKRLSFLFFRSISLIKFSNLYVWLNPNNNFIRRLLFNELLNVCSNFFK